MPFKAVLDRVFKTRWGTWVAIHIGQRIDPYLMRATRGRIRISFTAPTILLTHTGAKTGERRTTPLLYFTDAANVVLIASKGGAPQHPAWYHNLKVHPEVEASTDGRPERYVAREAEGAERERLWTLATKLYSGYEEYQARATNRRIPVIVLPPSANGIVGVHIEHSQGDVEIVVYNRAILLFTRDSEAVKGIHRVCCRLDDLATRHAPGVASRRPACGRPGPWCSGSPCPAGGEDIVGNSRLGGDPRQRAEAARRRGERAREI